MWFTQKCHQLALWVVRMLTVKDATVIPATTLSALQAQMVAIEEYVSVHSGRLNDGTTRAVRRKLRNRTQDALDTLDGCHALERIARPI